MLTLRTHAGDEVEYPKPASKATFNETTGDGISWAAWSWNPVTGCLHGCDYCYARAIANRFPDGFPVGFTPLFHHERLDAPANTSVPAAHRGDPAWKRVFVCSMADLYGRWVPDEWIQQVHASMLASPWWQYILLTKFPARYVGLELPAGAWVGTSVDEQKRVRIAEDAFRKVEGVKVKWLSLEPLLEPLEFTDLSMFDWVVIGAQTETRQPDGIVPAFAPPAQWVVRITHQALEAGCKVHWKPNLRTGPGMVWLDEYPGVD
jgi:protein gp37